MANTITTTNPTAAHGISMGLIFKTPGRIKPIPANTSEIPINRTKASGASITKGIETDSSCRGVVALGSPAIINMAARITWEIHKAMDHRFDLVFVVFILKYIVRLIYLIGS